MIYVQYILSLLIFQGGGGGGYDQGRSGGK